MTSKNLIEISLNPDPQRNDRDDLDFANAEGERACNLLTESGIAAYWEYPGYINIPNDQAPDQPDNDFGYGALICGTINGPWMCQVVDETQNPLDMEFGEELPRSSTAEQIASMLLKAYPVYKKWWDDYRAQRGPLKESTRKQIRIGTLLSKYKNCLVTKLVDSGEMEGSVEELNIKPGDVILLPAGDEGSVPDDLDTYTVLPDLTEGRDDFSIHTDQTNNMPFLRRRGDKRPVPKSHPYVTVYRSNVPDHKASKFHPREKKVWNYAKSAFEPIVSSPEVTEKTMKESTQAIPDGTQVKFKMRDWGDDFEQLSPGISQHDGDIATVLELAVATEPGQKDFEYYDIEFSDGSRFSAISGYHLFPVKVEESAASIISRVMEDSPTGGRPLRHSFASAMDQFQRLDPEMKQRLKKCAENYLVQNGAEEVGSSDINHALVSLWNSYNDWNAVIADYDVEAHDERIRNMPPSEDDDRDPPQSRHDFSEVPSHDDAYIARVDNRLLDPRDIN